MEILDAPSAATGASEAGALQPTETTGHFDAPALKEWAVVCAAILEGEQIVTIRKGGIREEGRKFSVPAERFFLFPTYEHQAPELLKPAYRGNVERTQNRSVNGRLSISGYCDVTEIFKVTTVDELESLESKHIWTMDYVTERLNWKQRDPLWVLVLRSYRLPDTVEIPLLDSYCGCKSWIGLEEQLDFSGEPVLSDAAFRTKQTSVSASLE